jgi:hypothetical protein
VEKQALGFCAAIEPKLLLLSKRFQVFNFVLLVNDVFYFVLLRNIHLWIKTGTTLTQKDKKQTTPSENQAFCAALELSFWSPESASFGQ